MIKNALRVYAIASVQFLACICSDVFRRSSVDLMFAYVCLRCLLGKKAQKSRFTDCVLGKNAQSPRNLAFSVCRTTFPRFSDTSGGRATSTMDPSAARIWDPLRRSWPHTKPPCSAYTMYTLRMRELFLSRTQCTFQKSVFWLQYMYYIKFVETDFCLMISFGYIHHLTVHRTESQKLCWNIINMQLQLEHFNQTVPAVFQHIPRNLIGYSDLFKGGTTSYCSSLHVGRLRFHFLSRNFRRLEDSLPHEAMASCVNRYTRSFCHQRAQLPRAVWLRAIFSITFLAFVAKLFHLGLEGLSCCNETVELKLLFLQCFILKLKLLQWQCLQLQCACLCLRSFLQALTFIFLLPFPFPQSFPLRLNLVHLQCECVSLGFFLHALRFIFLLPFSQVFALRLKLLHLQCECLSLRFFLLQALTFLCQLLHLNVKFILLRVQACLGGCCLIPPTKKHTLKKSQGLPSSFQRRIQILFIWGSKTQNAKWVEFKPLLRSPFRPCVPVGSSKCSREPPGLGGPPEPRIQTLGMAASSWAKGRPDANPRCFPSSRPARHDRWAPRAARRIRWPPKERCEPPRPAPGWRGPGPSVALSRRWIRPKRRAGPARAPGRNRGASGIWSHWPTRTKKFLGTLQFSLPAPPAPRSQDPRVCPGGLSVLAL